MAFMDKLILAEKLEELGWTLDRETEGYFLIPPDSLFENKPNIFYVYSAVQLQNLLGVEIEERD